MNPYDYASHCFGGKWKPLILRAIYIEKTARFCTFKKVHSITEKMLSQALKDLEAEGLITRKVYPEIPIRVEYQLTPAGESLIHLMDDIYSWSRKQMLARNIPIDAEGEKWHGYPPAST
ncbi:MAG: putative transcriptional regulator [Firmicutes bacterium]|nr:putative transcriptional regulator [Bacillota bacterium]